MDLQDSYQALGAIELLALGYCLWWFSQQRTTHKPNTGSLLQGQGCGFDLPAAKYFFYLNV